MASKAFNKAMKIISEREQKAKHIAQTNYEEVCKKVPQIKVLTNFLAQTNIKLSRAIFSNENKKGEIFEQIMKENLKIQEDITTLLVKNGYPANYLKTRFTCSICEDTGFVRGERCSCLDTVIKEVNIAELNNSTSLVLNDFDSFMLKYYSDNVSPSGKSEKSVMGDILAFCKEYSDKFSLNSPSILMIGDTGLGKTHLSLAIANEIIIKGYTVLYASSLDVFRDLQNEHFGKSQNPINTMQTIIDADLVIIDDLGAEFETSFITSALYNIINSRLNFNRPTIINTNLTLKQVEARYTSRIASRLITLYKCLKFVGKDVRQIKLRNNEL